MVILSIYYPYHYLYSDYLKGNVRQPVKSDIWHKLCIAPWSVWNRSLLKILYLIFSVFLVKSSIDVCDGCRRRFMMVVTMRCWWPILHQLEKRITNTMILYTINILKLSSTWRPLFNYFFIESFYSNVEQRVMHTTVVWQSVTLFLTLVRHIFQFFQSYYRISNVVKMYNRRLTMGLSLYWRSDENVRLYGKLKLLFIINFVYDLSSIIVFRTL